MTYLRKVQPHEVYTAMEIIQEAKVFLKESGIDQWQMDYPDRACIEGDIATEKGYFMCAEEGQILAYMCIDFDGEPAYSGLKGQWLTPAEEPYVVLHRLAFAEAGRGKGLSAEAFRLTEQMAAEKGIRSFRVDTDDANFIMKRVLEKAGFKYCGEIWFDYSPKIAFEKIIS